MSIDLRRVLAIGLLLCLPKVGSGDCGGAVSVNAHATMCALQNIGFVACPNATSSPCPSNCEYYRLPVPDDIFPDPGSILCWNPEQYDWQNFATIIVGDQNTKVAKFDLVPVGEGKKLVPDPIQPIKVCSEVYICSCKIVPGMGATKVCVQSEDSCATSHLLNLQLTNQNCPPPPPVNIAVVGP